MNDIRPFILLSFAVGHLCLTERNYFTFGLWNEPSVRPSVCLSSVCDVGAHNSEG